MACGQHYSTNFEKKDNKTTRLMGYSPIVFMELVELYMFELDININYRHLWDVFLLVRVTYLRFIRNCI